MAFYPIPHNTILAILISLWVVQFLQTYKQSNFFFLYLYRRRKADERAARLEDVELQIQHVIHADVPPKPASVLLATDRLNTLHVLHPQGQTRNISDSPPPDYHEVVTSDFSVTYNTRDTDKLLHQEAQA